jgi:hypothetical protein
MKQIALAISILAFFGGLLSAQPCCERAVIDELYMPEVHFTATAATIDTPDTNPNPCDSCRILIDMSDVELHGNNLDSLFAFLNRSFCEVVIDSTGISPEGFDVFCFPYKDDSISITRIREIQDYVYNGGTLILLGECCGFSWTLNDLLSDIRWNLGLSINSDVINDSVNYYGTTEISIFSSFSQNPLTAGFDSLILNRGGSVESEYTSGRLIWGSVTAFSFIWDSLPDTFIVFGNEPPVLAYSHFGEGNVVVCSDMSIWDIGVFIPGHPYNYANSILSFSIFNCNKYPVFNYNTAKSSHIFCFPETLDFEISIENYGMIEPDSVQVKWESTVLTVASPFVSVSDSTLSLSLPLDSYFPGDTVNLCIEAICDTGGYWPFDSICWWYYLDPFVDSLGPLIERITTDSLYPGDTLLAYVYDTSGIDTASIFGFDEPRLCRDLLFRGRDACYMGLSGHDGTGFGDNHRRRPLSMLG